MTLSTDGGSDGHVYAPVRHVQDVGECAFYHTMVLPGHGLVHGQWDLRDGVDDYLGGVVVRGRRVLELGTADGFLSFSMERSGAEVVSFDLGPDDGWDVVPYSRSAGTDGPSWVTPSGSVASTLQRLNNAYWFSHRAFSSEARLVNGTVYDVPAEIGPVDIAVFGCLLLHTRDPFGALASGLHLTRHTAVVTDALGALHLPAALRCARSMLPAPLRRPIMRFLPDWRTSQHPDGWWRLTPEIVVSFLGVLGFERCKITFHRQPYNGRPKRLFTVVGHRTRPRIGD